MVYIDIDGLPDDLRVPYRPSRLSLFPPSYGDRALLRSIKRQALRQVKDAGQPEPPEPGDEKKAIAKTTQTGMSYCYHTCPEHPPVTEPHGGNGKKGKEQGKGKGGESKSKKDKGKGGKGKQGDSDNDDGGDSEDEDAGQKSKEKSKGEKSKEDKSKGKKGDKSASFNPHLPYPWSSPNFPKIYGQSLYPSASMNEKLTKNDQYRLGDFNPAVYEPMVEPARRKDEEYILRWLAEKESLHQRGAVKWLEDRDTARFGKIAELNRDFMNLDIGAYNQSSQRQQAPAVLHTYPNQRHVSFAEPDLPSPPRPLPQSGHGQALPTHLGGLNPGGSDDGSIRPSRPRPGKAVAAYYDENRNLCLEDGTKVIVPPVQGFAPPAPFPGSSRPPLQPINGATPAPPGGAQWSQPTQVWQNSQYQAPFASAPAYPQAPQGYYQPPPATQPQAHFPAGPAYPQAQQGFHQNQPMIQAQTPNAPMQAASGNPGWDGQTNQNWPRNGNTPMPATGGNNGWNPRQDQNGGNNGQGNQNWGYNQNAQPPRGSNNPHHSQKWASQDLFMDPGDDETPWGGDDGNDNNNNGQSGGQNNGWRNGGGNGNGGWNQGNNNGNGEWNQNNNGGGYNNAPSGPAAQQGNWNNGPQQNSNNRPPLRQVETNPNENVRW